MPDALATVADLQALGVPGDETLLDALLAKASARFRTEAGNDITEAEYDMVLRNYGGTVRLPVIPVVEVTSVTWLNLDGSDGAPVVGYYFDGIDTLTVSDCETWVVNGPTDSSNNVRVAWTAGFATVPEDVRWAVASMVERAQSGPAPALTGETIGDYSWRGGSFTASGALSMSNDERAIAAKYRTKTSTLNARLA